MCVCVRDVRVVRRDAKDKIYACVCAKKPLLLKVISQKTFSSMIVYFQSNQVEVKNDKTFEKASKRLKI